MMVKEKEKSEGERMKVGGGKYNIKFSDAREFSEK